MTEAVLEYGAPVGVRGRRVGLAKEDIDAMAPAPAVRERSETSRPDGTLLDIDGDGAK
jgi:hypothetical protein